MISVTKKKRGHLRTPRHSVIMQILAHVRRLIKCGFLSFKITDHTRNISIENARRNFFGDDDTVNLVFIVMIKKNKARKISFDSQVWEADS